MGFIRDTFLGGAEERAAQTQAQSARDAANITSEAEARAREDLQPFTDTGAGALPDLGEEARRTGGEGFVDEFNDFTQTGGTLTGGESQILRDALGQSPVDSLVANPDADQARTLQSLRNMIQEGGGDINNFIRGGADTRALDVLRNEILNPRDSSFERQEGFDDILSAATAAGKRRAGGTFRDLAEFNSALNERNRGNRIRDITNFVGLESDLRGRRLNELVGNRGRSLSELRSLLSDQSGTRSNRLNELLTARQQRLSEGALASAAELGPRERRTAELLTRIGVNTGDSDNRFSRLLQLANLGQSSAAGQANISVGSGAERAGLRVGEGNALAAGLIGKKRARLGSISDLVSLGTGLIKPQKRVGTSGPQNGVMVGGGLVA